MNKLDRRDRRRALKVVLKVWEASGLSEVKVPLAYYVVSRGDAVRIVAAALKREREDTGMAAMKFFLFSGKADRAQAKRAIKSGAKVSA